MKKFMCIIIVVSLSVVLLTGCRFFEEIEEHRIDSNVTYNSKGPKKNSTISDDIFVDGSELVELKVKNGVGNIAISKGTGNDIEVHYDKRIKYTGENVEEVADAILVNTKVSGSKLTVEVRSADDNIQDLWQWLSDKFKGINVSVDLDIKVPENIEVVVANTGVGNVTINDVEGSVVANSGVGNVSLNDVAMCDDCKINSGTGNIYIDGSADNLSKLKALTGVGNIRVILPGDTKLSIKATTGVGDIEGSLISNDKKGFVSDSLKQDINGGGAEAKIETGTGNINIAKK